MSYLNLTEETWLDLTVNFIPVGILFVLDVLFWAVNPWGWNPLYVFWAHWLTLFPLVLLLLLTYVSGVVVQRDEHAEGLTDEDTAADAPGETE